MKNNSLAEKGLSLSQAQSISNMCFQRSREITADLERVNNASKSLSHNGSTYIETPAAPLPANTIDLLTNKAKLHALQAFLMENIKAKDTLLKKLKSEYFEYTAEQAPQRPERVEFDPIPLVGESYGWEQLPISEINEFYEAEAFAAHIGQFIHKGGKLDDLRNELPKLKTLEWMEIETGKKTPVMVTAHHNAADLLTLHENLAALHRSFEQRVNYFKAKVKNLVTVENARISKENAIKQEEVNIKNKAIEAEFKAAQDRYTDASRKAFHEFEEARQNEISRIAALRIAIDPRFQALVDEFLMQLN